MATVNRHYEVHHHWGSGDFTEDDQAEMWISWDTEIVFPNDLEYIDVTVSNVNYATRKGNSQPWSQTIGQDIGIIDAWVFGFAAPGSSPIYVWPDDYLIPWNDDGSSPIGIPGTQYEDFDLCTAQFKTVYPELAESVQLIEGSYMRTDAVYSQVRFDTEERHQYHAGLRDTWTFQGATYHHRYETNGVLPNPLKLFRSFIRYTDLSNTPNNVTHFFDGIIEEPLPPEDEPTLTKYFPWAIRKDHDDHQIWKSCNRFSEADPDAREGQLEIRNELAGNDNVLNDYINEREQLGYHYRNGQWQRAPLNGWWSGPDLPWDGVNDAPPLGVQMASILANGKPRITGLPGELGTMSVTATTTNFTL